MKIDRLFACFILIAAMTSCNAPDEKKLSATPAGDSSSQTGEAGAGLIEKFKTLNSLPFVADTTLMFRMDACDSLGTLEVRQLDQNWATRDSSAETYVLKEFYRIDSIKASGTYAAWCDSLQPGMTKSSNACAVARVMIDDQVQLLVWGLLGSSYEACPVTTMQNIYVSILKGKVVAQTFKLSEYTSAADPPVAMQRIVTGIINKDLTVDMNLYEEDDEDMDLPELNVTKAKYRLAIKDGRISTLSEKKEEPVKVKRKR